LSSVLALRLAMIALIAGTIGAVLQFAGFATVTEQIGDRAAWHVVQAADDFWPAVYIALERAGALDWRAAKRAGMAVHGAYAESRSFFFLSRYSRTQKSISLPFVGQFPSRSCLSLVLESSSISRRRSAGTAM
jgi:hypothetical protein